MRRHSFAFAAFQSPPASKGGCNGRIRGGVQWIDEFQSPPASKGGCNDIGHLHHVGMLHVSIPTRLERRVQRFNAGGIYELRLFQSPPASKGGCNLPARRRRLQKYGFNPHPPRKAGATSDRRKWSLSPVCFNPHPPRKAGATSAKLGRLIKTFVSIPTRLERRVQPVSNSFIYWSISVSIPTRLERRVQPASRNSARSWI